MRSIFICMIFFGLILFFENASADDTFDDFERADSNSFGVARSLSTWNTFGAEYSIQSGMGVISGIYPGTDGFATIGFDGAADSEGIVTLSVPMVPQGGDVDAGIALRVIGNGFQSQIQGYAATLRFRSTQVFLRLSRLSNGDFIPIGETIRLKGQPRAGEQFKLQFAAVGSNPTVLLAKFWPAELPAPSDWQLVAQDNTSSLQGGTSVVGLVTTGSSTLIGTNSVMVDNFLVRDCGRNCRGEFSPQNNRPQFRVNVLADMTHDLSQFDETEINLSELSGNPTYVRLESRCEGQSQAYFRYMTATGEQIYLHTLCRVQDPSNVFMEDGELIPVPEGAVRLGVIGGPGFRVAGLSGSVRITVFGDLPSQE